MGKTSNPFVLLILAAATAALWSAPAQAGALLSYRVLHTICAKDFSCPDGAGPSGEQLVRDAGGDLFGTTAGGGRNQKGTLYKLISVRGGARYYEHVLRSFCFPGKCGTGSQPSSGVIMDTAGNLYGTTPANGESACGVVFESIISGDTAGMKPLHTFGAPNDGCNPSSIGALEYQGKDTGQLYDGTSPLYGLTLQGGANGHGALYELTPPKPGHKNWGETILVSFCGLAFCTDSDTPQSNLVMDAAGDLFFATTHNKIMKVVPDIGGYIMTLAYRSHSSENYAALSIETDGTVIGLAGSGGTTSFGTLFKLTFDPVNGYEYTLLHDFCPTDCSDGAFPAAVTTDSSGNIFGVTNGGGTGTDPYGTSNGAGVIFEYSTGGNYSVLHSFCVETDCTDGGLPSSGLTLDGNGNLFGVTFAGGVPSFGGAGVVYELSTF
jgi:uncharacterized repeat protein (TIGR03803 family)